MCEVVQRQNVVVTSTTSTDSRESSSRRHRWNHLKDETDLERMLANSSSIDSDSLFFDDITSTSDNSTVMTSRPRVHSNASVMSTSPTTTSITDGVGKLTFDVGHRRRSLDEHSSCSSSSGSDCNSDAGDIQRSSNQSMACRVGQSQGQPVVTPSNRALDPFPELSHSCTPPSSTLYTGCFGEELTEEDDAVTLRSRIVPATGRQSAPNILPHLQHQQLLGQRLSHRQYVHGSSSSFDEGGSASCSGRLLQGYLRSSCSLSALGGRDQSEKVNWLPSGMIKTMLVVHFEDKEKTSRSVSVDELTLAFDLAHILADLQGAGHDRSWSIVEVLSRFQLERILEDHESVYQIHKSWPSMDNNRFVFRKEFHKYDFFVNPSFFSTQMLDSGKSSSDTYNTCNTSADPQRSRNQLLQNLCGANARLPDIKGYLQMKEGKRSWKRQLFVLRDGDLYYSIKGNSLDTKHLVLFSHLQDVLIYTSNTAKKTLCAPNNFCFCLKPTYNVTDVRQLKLLCADNEESRVCWVAALRVAKYGSQLSENFKQAVCDENAFVQSQYQDVQQHKDPATYSRQRVATGQEVRVVGNSDEPQLGGGLLDDAYTWRRRVARMQQRRSSPASTGTNPVNTASFLSPDNTSARIPTAQSSPGQHVTQPWFHGNISRDESCDLLLQRSSTDGVFLIRDSQSVAGAYVLSFVHNAKVKHCPILRIEEGNSQMVYTMDGGRMRFSDLAQLIDFYQLNAGGLPTLLTQYVSRLS